MKWSRRVVVRMLMISIWAVSLLALAYPAKAQAQGGGGGVHVVATGETLRDVAQQAGTDVGTLISINGLSNGDVIYVGQQLALPGGSPDNGGWEQPSRQNQDAQNWQGSDNSTQPSWADQGNQPQGMGYDPSQAQNAQQGSNQQNDDWQWTNSNDNGHASGMSWDPSQSGQNSGYAGVAYDPSASQQGANSGGPQGPNGGDPNGGEPAWNSQPDNGSYAPETSGSPQGAPQRPGQSNDDWAWTNSDDNPYGQGNSWEPSPSVTENRDVALSGEKWIDIDLSSQELYAYQGDTVVRSFIISSGSANYPTVTGTYYTYARYDLQDMSGGSAAAGDYYFQPDVPFVQYFFEGFSIHGAYWHNLFGTPTGHGCINMRVGEAQWLYDWTAVTGIRVVVHY